MLPCYAAGVVASSRAPGPGRARAWLLACCVVAVAGTPEVASGGQRPDGDLPAIVLLRDASASWRVVYRLPWPVEELRFERTARGLRTGWTVLTPGYELVPNDADAELVRRSAGGEPADTVEVLFPEETTLLAGEYEPVLLFGGGGVAVYTGHLRAVAVPAGGGRGVAVRALRVVPWRDLPVLVAGRAHEGSMRFEDRSSTGVYAYFGTPPEVLGGRARLVLDPALPQWIAERCRALLPRLLQLYELSLGASLPEPPLVLFTWAGDERSGLTSHGGALQGQIQLTLEGSGWLTLDADARGQLDRLLAHEAAHLWSGQLVQGEGSGIDWLTEGGIEALAERALVELGELDRAARAARASAAVFDCLLRLGDSPADADRWPERSEYTCGSVVAGLWTETALAGKQEGGALAVWRRLIAAALTRQRRYDAEAYFEALLEAGAPTATAAAMRGFVLDPAAAAGSLAAQLRQAGARLDEAAPPRAIGWQLARRALEAVMAADCGGAVSFVARDGELETSPRAGCHGFAQPRSVVSLGGQSLRERGEAAYDQVAESCRAGAAIAVVAALPDAAFEVRCERPLPERPPYFEIAPW